jgi:hypothetical protein
MHRQDLNANIQPLSRPCIILIAILEVLGRPEVASALLLHPTEHPWLTSNYNPLVYAAYYWWPEMDGWFE